MRLASLGADYNLALMNEQHSLDDKTTKKMGTPVGKRRGSMAVGVNAYVSDLEKMHTTAILVESSNFDR
tara:strand:+ start:104 stop:310 length:207 start_codon:yes stop_codon:yes gene_type:complete